MKLEWNLNGMLEYSIMQMTENIRPECILSENHPILKHSSL